MKQPTQILIIISAFFFAFTLSAAPFIDNGNGTILDKQTGLTWQKCTVGQTNDATCSGGASTIQWATALTTCSGLGLASRTWRLPSVKELKTIVDTTIATSPSIDIAFFPSTVASVYWSSTTYAPSTTNAWIVNFFDGVISGNNKTVSNQVRCVSGP
jgi:hypothetical protein